MNLGNRLKRGFSWSFAGNVFGYALGIITAPILTRLLSPEEFGVVSLANSARSMLLILMPMCAGGAVSYWFNLHRTEPAERNRAIGTITFVTGAISTLWLVLALVLGSLFQARLLPGFTLPFWPYGALVVFSAWLLTFQVVPMALLGARERQDAVAFINIGVGVAQTTFILIFIALLHRGAPGQVEAMFAYALFVLPLWLYLLWRFARPYADMVLARQVLRYSIPILPHVLSIWALNLSDRLIIAGQGPRLAADLGRYSFAYAIAAAMYAIVTGFNSIWSPVYLEQARSNPNAKRVLGYAASWSCLALAISAAGIILISPVLVVILAPPKYYGSIPYIAPVVVAYFMQATYMFPAMAFFHLKLTHRLPVITGTAVAVCIALNLLLIPYYGVIVAAWTTALGFSLMALMAYLMCHRAFPLEYPRGPMALSAVTILGTLGISTFTPATPVLIAVRVLLWLLFAAGCGLMWWKRGRSATPA